MGVHSGPIHRAEDINDTPNVRGPGINLAQRVMDCGDAGNILLSYMTAEALIVSEAWKSRLHDLGEVEVKHGVRVHMDGARLPNALDFFAHRSDTAPIAAPTHRYSGTCLGPIGAGSREPNKRNGAVIAEQ